MSIQAMRGALQARLLTLGWENQTAFERRAFTPSLETPYQEVSTVFGDPIPTTLAGSDEQRGMFQVRLMYPLSSSEGLGEATTRAELIAAAFPRNLKLVGAGGQIVKIMRKPAIIYGPPQGDRAVTILRIRFTDR